MLRLALPLSGVAEESVTWTVNADGPAGPVGTPAIVPVVAPSVNPAGSAPDEIEKLSGAVPPFAIRVCPYADPTAPLGKVLGAIVNPPPPPPVGVKVAVTVSAALIVTVQVSAPVGRQFVLKAPNVKFVPGAAVSATWLLPAKVAVQLVVQAVIPAGELVTLPVPVTVTVSAAAPVPETLIVWVVTGALSVIVIVPVDVTNCVGANATSITQLAPTASVAGATGQGFADVASENTLAPVSKILEILRGASPEFVTVTGRVELALIGWFAKPAVLLERVMSALSITFLIRLLNKSPTYMLPRLSTTIPSGLAKLADRAGPPSPANAKVPFPANVVIIPVVPSTRRITLFPKSEMKMLPAPFADTLTGEFRVALVAKPPSPVCPAAPVPERVVMIRGEPVSIL